jgi:hypothetical protein
LDFWFENKLSGNPATAAAAAHSNLLLQIISFSGKQSFQSERI